MCGYLGRCISEFQPDLILSYGHTCAVSMAKSQICVSMQCLGINGICPPQSDTFFFLTFFFVLISSFSLSSNQKSQASSPLILFLPKTLPSLCLNLSSWVCR